VSSEPGVVKAAANNPFIEDRKESKAMYELGGRNEPESSSKRKLRSLTDGVSLNIQSMVKGHSTPEEPDGSNVSKRGERTWAPRDKPGG